MRKTAKKKRAASRPLGKLTRPSRNDAPVDYSVRLVLNDGAPPIEIKRYASLKRDAMYWSYVARTRARWTGTAAAVQRQESPVRAFLNDEQLERIAKAGAVEVEIPFETEDANWEARVLPWEYLISQATRTFRQGAALAVTRRLAVGGTPTARAVNPDSVGILQCAPLALARLYNVAGESDLVRNALGASIPGHAAPRIPPLVDPTRNSLSKWIAENPCDIIHVAGVDTHRAIDLLDLDAEIPVRERRDGLALRLENATRPDFVNAEDLAQLLCGGAKPPRLVFFNFYNSASRVAALAIARGADYAIGYQDTIDDNVAAIFLNALYRTLERNGGDVRLAFREALALIQKDSEKLRGACVVLWSRSSLLATTAGVSQRMSRRKLRAATEVEPQDWLNVDCRPFERLNYSLLHNQCSLFEKLQLIRQSVEGALRDIELTVTLHVGADGSTPFVKMVSLEADEASIELKDRVIVPLTSALMRTRSERIQSSLQVCVKCKDVRIFHETFRVWLSPVDEWQDGQRADWAWLPSFVLPRDAGVVRIIDSAQRYLVALSDDPGAGFDGYQSVDGSAMPGAPGDPVDAQVRAIWHALVQEYGLSYINPPPSYGNLTQRLRVTSQILADRRGTCIDLALMLAACLEYVDIYPVIFLLKGHAFPGYWRSDALQDAFRQVLDVKFEGSENEQNIRSSASNSRLNAFVPEDRSNFDEIRQQVYAGNLVPIETVWMTNHSSFASALEEGLNNLRNRSEFEAMLDIRTARDRDVTPVPLIWSQS